MVALNLGLKSVQVSGTRRADLHSGTLQCVSLVTQRSTLPLDVLPVGFIFHILAGKRATRMAVHLGILNYIRMYTLSNKNPSA